MRVVVTGASGNVGTALLRRLGDADDSYSVVGVSRRRPVEVAPYDCEWAGLDIGLPGAVDQLTEIFEGADAVVHLAWLIQPRRERELLRRVNQDGTRAVLAAAEAAGVRHLVHMSSVGAYSPAPAGTVADESWPTEGVATSAYSVDKAVAERIIEGARSIAVTTLRPGLILQPDAASEIARYFLGRLVPLRAIRPGLMRLVPWPAQLATQFVHANDVADAIELVLRLQATGPFNLAAAPAIDRDEFRRIFGARLPGLPRQVTRALLDLSWRARLQPTDPGWVDLAFQSPLLDTSRARGVLGWAPTRSADQLLRDFLMALGDRRGAAGPLLHPEEGSLRTV